MKALVKAKSERGLWMLDVPEPSLGPDDVLIRVHQTGIRGTDFHIYEWDAWAQKTIKVPMVVGHEFVGEVVAFGSNVGDFQVGELGGRGRGSHEHCDVIGRVDFITGTLDKAFGGMSGGFASGRREMIEMLRQRSRPNLFSNSLAPMIAGASLEAFQILNESTVLRDTLMHNTHFFRGVMTDAGFNLVPGTHPIFPVMLGDANLATKVADEMLKQEVYVVGFSYPVVPIGLARIRTQISAPDSLEELDRAVRTSINVRNEFEFQ